MADQEILLGIVDFFARVCQAVAEDATGERLDLKTDVPPTALVACTGVGKSTVIELLSVLYLQTSEDYSRLRRGIDDDLEGVRIAKKLATAEGREKPDIREVKLSRLADVQQRQEEMRDDLLYTRSYKLVEKLFSPRGILFPRGGEGGVGTVVTCAVSFGQVTQLVAQFMPLSAIHAMLTELLAHLTKDKARKRVLGDVRKEALLELWPTLTANANLREALNAWEQDPGYQPPVCPWVASLAGCIYVFVANSQPADLFTDLCIIHDINYLLMLPGNDDATLDTAQCSMLEQLARQHTATHSQGLNPFQELLERAEEPEELLRLRKAWCALIVHVQLLIPNQLLLLGNIQIMDSVGLADADPTHCMRQVAMEDKTQHMVVLLPAELRAQGAAVHHLLNSDYMGSLLRNLLDSRAPSRPRMSFMVYREKTGHPPPKKHRIKGESINLEYLLHLWDTLEESNQRICDKTKEELQRLIAKFLQREIAGASAQSVMDPHNPGVQGLGRLVQSILQHRGIQPEWRQTAVTVHTNAVNELAKDLASAVHITHSVPMLGLACHQAMAHFNANSLPGYLDTDDATGDEVLAKLRKVAETAPGLPATGAEGEQPALGGTQNDFMLRTALDKAVVASRVEQFTGLMVEPAVACCQAMVDTTLAAVTDERRQTANQLEFAQHLVDNKEHIKTLSWKGKRTADIWDEMHQALGEDTFGALLDAGFSSAVDENVEDVKAQVAAPLKRACLAVANHLAKLLKDDRAATMEALNPTYKWRHSRVRVRSVMLNFVLGCCEDPLNEVLKGPLQERVVNLCITQLLTDTSIEHFFTDEISGAGVEKWEFLKNVFESVMQGGAKLQQLFQSTCFPRNRKVASNRWQQRILKAAVEQLSGLTAMDELYDIVLAASKDRDPASATPAALKRWGADCSAKLVEMVTINLHEELTEVMKTFRKRVYQAPKRENPTRRKNTEIVTLLKGVCLAVMSAAEDEAEVELAREQRLAQLAHLLKQLSQPDQVATWLLDPTIRKDQPDKVLMEQLLERLAEQDGDGPEPEPLPAAAASMAELLASGLRVAQGLITSATPVLADAVDSELQDDGHTKNWGDDFCTKEQLEALRESLRSQGLRLGTDPHTCVQDGYLAVLHQLRRLPLNRKDQILLERRGFSCDLAKISTRELNKVKKELRGTVKQRVEGTKVIKHMLQGVTPDNYDAVKSAVQRHIEGVRVAASPTWVDLLLFADRVHCNIHVHSPRWPKAVQFMCEDHYAPHVHVARVPMHLVSGPLTHWAVVGASEAQLRASAASKEPTKRSQRADKRAKQADKNADGSTGKKRRM